MGNTLGNCFWLVSCFMFLLMWMFMKCLLEGVRESVVSGLTIFKAPTTVTTTGAVE